MNEVVFISDLHLHPKRLDIQAQFDAFIEWAKKSTQAVYILGDFFHVWVGDDAIDDWSRGIASQLYSLKTHGISVFYMPGNRDFLLGKTFAGLAGWRMLPEPFFIRLHGKKVMLSHGDGFCTMDKSHQCFRFLTRNRLFKALFLSLPLLWRQKISDTVRKSSMQNKKPPAHMDVVLSSIVKHMAANGVDTLIHGHTHKRGLSRYPYKDTELMRYVLSDWDDRPSILSYNKSNGIYFAFF